MSECAKLRRHWFQFSLRSALLVVTFVSMGMAWVANELDTVRQRQAYIKLLEARSDGVLIVTLDSYIYNVEGAAYKIGWSVENQRETDKAMERKSAPSWFRKLLGDMHVVFLIVPRSDTVMAEELFPDAYVTSVTLD